MCARSPFSLAEAFETLLFLTLSLPPLTTTLSSSLVEVLSYPDLPPRLDKFLLIIIDEADTLNCCLWTEKSPNIDYLNASEDAHLPMPVVLWLAATAMNC